MSSSRGDHDVHGPVWIVGEFDDGVVVVREREAMQLAILNDALRDAVTWADFLQMIDDDPDLLTEVRERCGDELPEESEPFGADGINGFSDGDWPKSPKELMMASAPASIAALTTASPTLFGNDFMQVSPRRRGELIERVGQAGLPYREDDDLIRRASGAWRYG